MAKVSKWDRFKPPSVQSAGSGGPTLTRQANIDPDVPDGTCRTPLSADTKPRSAHKSPRLARVLGRASSAGNKKELQPQKAVETPPPSPKVSKWARFKPPSLQQQQTLQTQITTSPTTKVATSPTVSRWSRFKPKSQESQDGLSPSADTGGSNCELTPPAKVSKWARFKPKSVETANTTHQQIPPVPPKVVLSPPEPEKMGPYGLPLKTYSPGVKLNRQHTIGVHAPDGAAPKMSFRRLVKNVAHVPDLNITTTEVTPVTPPPKSPVKSPMADRHPFLTAALALKRSQDQQDQQDQQQQNNNNILTNTTLLNGEKPCSPGFFRCKLSQTSTTMTGLKTDSDSVSVTRGFTRAGIVTRGVAKDNVSDMLQVDDDMKRKLRDDIDVSMVTLLQPTEMLRSEMYLHEAARKNSVDKVRELIAQKVDVNSRNNLDRTPIQWAAANGHMEVVSILIHAGADVEAQDKYGMKALLWAAWFGHLDTIRVLVNGGANTTSVNKQGQTVLHCAAQNNHVDVISYICDSLENFKLNEVEKNERTALHLAAEKGHTEAIDKLLEFKADLQIKDKSGQTAGHVAASNGHDELIKRFLLEGIDVDDRDNDGQTALILAAIGGHLNTVEMLLRANADPNAETTKQMTALMAASQQGNKDVVSALLEFGCDVNVANHQGNTAIHLATLGNHIEVMRLLIDAYAELNNNNKRLQTPLHAAVENGLADAVEVLLVAGADIEAKEKTGKTALQMASRGSFIGIVDMIIKAERHQQLGGDPEEGVAEFNHIRPGTPIKKLSVCTASGGSQLNIQFKRPNHECTEFMKDILWKMATKQLKPGDWKRLAHYWKFTDAHIKAIEHQYTGPHSYTEHGYRMLLIWLHSVKKEDSPMKHLFEALVAIDRRELAEHIRRKANVSADKSTSPKICRVS